MSIGISSSIPHQHSATYNESVNFLPPGFFLCLAAAYIGNGRYIRAFRGELVGSLIMVSLTYTLCHIFSTTMSMSWKAHSVGSALGDLIGGGDFQINPAMTMAFLALGCLPGGYTEAFVRVAGQVAGGLLSFPLCAAVCELFGMDPYKGLDFELNTGNAFNGAFAELFGTFLYCFVLLWVSYELHFGKAMNFVINKAGKSLTRKTAFMLFSATGPAMNPILATAWDVFGIGQSFKYPNDFLHFFVYWMAPLAGGALAALAYATYKGGYWMGHPVSVDKVTEKVSPAKEKKEL